MWFSNLRLSRKFALGFACVLLSVGTTSALLFRTLRAVEASAQLNIVSNDVLDEVDRAVAAVFDQSQSVRSYTLTQDAVHAKRYEAAGRTFADRMASARRDAAAHPEILPLIGKI